MKDAVKAYEDLYNKKSDENPFVILKCPWCGAQMGLVKLKNGDRRLPGYSKRVGKNRQKTFKFVCSNVSNNCDFSSEKNPLPLHVIDDDIYEVKPKRKFFKKKDNNKMLNEKNEKFKEDEIVVRNQILKY